MKRVNRLRTSLRALGTALALVLCLCTHVAKGQIAGMSTLSVLDMGVSARAAALGMDYLSVWDNDINIGVDNPSLIDKRYGNMMSFDFVGFFAGAKMGSVNYGLNKGGLGSFVVGMRFNSYGRFQGYDEAENPTGTFGAADYALTVGWGMHVDSNFSIGAAFKPTFSQYESYSAMALAFDVCGSYVGDNKQFAATVMARNIGAQIMTFDGTTEKIHTELSAAMSYKLDNAPFRFYVAATELQKWNLLYDDPLYPTTTTDLFTGEVSRRTGLEEFSDNLFRHVNVGVELCLGKAFFGRLGYSYRQSAETRSVSLTSLNTSGFSFGFGFRVKGFDLAYSRNNYYLGKAPNFISITTQLDRFFK